MYQDCYSVNKIFFQYCQVFFVYFSRVTWIIIFLPNNTFLYLYIHIILVQRIFNILTCKYYHLKKKIKFMQTFFWVKYDNLIRTVTSHVSWWIFFFQAKIFKWTFVQIWIIILSYGTSNLICTNFFLKYKKLDDTRIYLASWNNSSSLWKTVSTTCG